LDNLLEFAYYHDLDIKHSFLTLDTGFDSQYNRKIISDSKLISVIKPNMRRLKDQTKRYKRLDGFEKYQDIYSQRYIIERCFAWEDKYRKLVIRYEKLQCTFMGFRNLAYSMINFRNVFN